SCVPSHSPISTLFINRAPDAMRAVVRWESGSQIRRPSSYPSTSSRLFIITSAHIFAKKLQAQREVASVSSVSSAATPDDRAAVMGGAEGKRRHFSIPHYRFLVLVVATMVMTSVTSNALALNFTLICMEQPTVAVDKVVEALRGINSTKGN